MRLLQSPFLFFQRHPWRALAILGLLALLGLAIAVGARFWWFDHHLRAARQAVERAHNAVAIAHLKRCRQFRPDDPAVLLLSARVAWRGGAWSEADALLDRYSQLYGDDNELALERQLFRATRGEIEAVRPLLQARIDQDQPEAAVAREALILGLLYRYRLNDAEQQIDRWLQREPDTAQALFLRAKLFEEREQSTEALATYRHLVELDPEHDLARLRLTAILLQFIQGAEALPHLEYLRRRLPDNPEVEVQMARALDLQGRGDDARRTLDKCLRSFPDDAAALAQRGWIASREADGALAEEYLRRSIKLDPSSLTARHQYFVVLNRNGKKGEAAKVEEALREAEADVRRVGELFRGRLQETPNDPAIYYEVAMIAMRAGRPKEGLRWLHNALQVDPNHLPTHRALAMYYHETGNPILSARHRAIAQRLSMQAERKN